MATPVKQYDVIKTSTRFKDFQIQHAGQIVFQATVDRGFMRPPQINLSSPSSNSVVASCKLRTMSSSNRLCLNSGVSNDASPSPSSSESAWSELSREGMGMKWRFSHAGRTFNWTRTHDKELGARSMGGVDFKLVDAQTQQVLAVWLNARGGMFGSSRSSMATVKYFADIGSDLEALSFTAIFAIQLRIRAAAAGAGA